MSSVCRSLRSALMGPDAGALWDVWCLHSANSGLNSLAISQGHHATTVMLHGGGWEADALWDVLAPLAQADTVRLSGITGAGEAAVIGKALAAASCRKVFFSGSVPCDLPRGVRTLTLLGENGRCGSDGLVDQSAALQLFGCLVPLTLLESLTLALPYLQLDEALSQQLAQQHSRLQHLYLFLYASSNMGLPAIPELPASVMLELHVLALDCSLAQLLRSLRGVRLLSLAVSEVQTRDYRLTQADDHHLARLSISQQLNLRLVPPLRRFPQASAVFPVVYEQTPFMQAD